MDTETGIAEILALGLAPDEKAAEINAFVTKKFVRRGPAGGAPRGRPERPTGPGRFPPGSASVPARPPPRDRADVQCINCNRKGHTAQDCRQPRVEKDQRKCFLCDKPGHAARATARRGGRPSRPSSILAPEDAQIQPFSVAFRSLMLMASHQ